MKQKRFSARRLGTTGSGSWLVFLLGSVCAVAMAAGCQSKRSDGARPAMTNPWTSQAGGSAAGRHGSKADPAKGSSNTTAEAVPAEAVPAEATPAEAASSGSGARPADATPASPGMLGGLGMLSRIGESLGEPGPYEAPTSSAGFDKDAAHWLVLTLAGPVVERAAMSWSGQGGSELRAIQQRFAALAVDPKLLGVVLRFADLELSFPDALELRDAIKQLRKAGKRVVCHSHGTGNVEYLVMAACDRLAVAPLGQIAITGPAAMPVHLRPLLARFGVVADFLHVGAYKGAAEPFTRDAPSPEMNEVLGQILDQHYQTMVDVIAADRALPVEQVKALIDVGVHAPEQAVVEKLSDSVASFEAFRDAEVKAPWSEGSATGEDDRLSPANPMQAMSKLMQFLGAQPAIRPTHPRVAVVYAIGNIIDGAGQGLLGARQEISPATLVAALNVLANDASVKAVVLRVDSGGGSAQASELIWQAMTALREKKPVVVSMSDVAASGGYYISCNATRIFAETDTLTGSIGVVGGHLAFGPALAQQGVRTYPIGRGKRATMTASLAAWTPDQRAVIQQMMQDVYQTFVSRVAAGRKLTVEQVQAIAQGRVWTGAKAKELGLVDELGGLEAAYAEAAKLGGVDVGAEAEIYPPTPTLRDFAVSFGQVSAGWLGSGAELRTLAALDPALAETTGQLIEQLASFRTSAIQTVAWLPRIR
jgi:protease IV